MFSSLRMIFFVLILAAGGQASHAQGTQPRIANPAVFSLELIKDLEKAGANVVADKIVQAVVQPGAKAQLSTALAMYEKKPAKVAKIAADRDFGGAVRVITVYAYGVIAQNPYLYFQMVYKMTDTGWVMSGFSFKAEAMHAFPPDMAPYIR